MANNRLYIFDPETKKATLIAKHYANGWYVPAGESENDNLSRKLDLFFNELESNRGWGDYDGVELQLLVEKQLPEDVIIINTPPK